jgi:hypothetical protein
MSDFSTIELATTVDLNYRISSDGKPVYHLIYASQLYGTVFAMYGRFEGREINIDADKAFAIDKISLAILNYKGIINIGFTENDFGWDIDDKQDNFFFGVMGTSTKVDHEVPLADPIVVKKGTPIQMTFNRTLRPLPGFDGYLSNRPAHSPNPSGLLTATPPILPLFDSEFNDRDGTDFYNKDLRLGMAGYNNVRMSLVAGRRCVHSNVRLLYY